MSIALIVSKKQIESGEYGLKGKMAMRVYGDAVDHVNGVAMPIYVVSDREVAEGDFKVASGHPVKMVGTRSAKLVAGKKATPVYVMSGSIASAAWLPEDGLPNNYKVPVARFNFMDIPVGSMVLEAAAVGNSGYVLRQPSVLSAPWMSASGLVTRNGGLVIPEELRGSTAAIDWGSISTSQVLGDTLGGYEQPIKEIVVYPDLSHAELKVLDNYFKSK